MPLATRSRLSVDERRLPAEPRADTAVRLAYLVSKYPAPSHTFIRREIDAMRQRGVILETFSLRRPHPEERQDDTDLREFENTWYVRPVGLRGLIAAHLRALVSGPRRYVRTLGEALRHRIPGLNGLAGSLRLFAEAIVLASELRRRGHVHLHNHFANDGGDVGFLATTYLGISWSLTLHGTSEFDYPSVVLLPRKIRAAAFVACVSHFGRAQAMRVVEPEQWSKLFVVRCGVELGRLPARARAPDGGPLRLLSVGRFSAEKGQVGLIAAFAKAVARGARAELRLIGDGPERARIQDEILRQGLGPHCTLLGRLAEPVVLREMADADLFVLASFMEGLPVVLMEALGVGVPVIAPCVAGIPELVRPGKTGLLFSPGNWDELSEHILTVIEDPGLRHTLATAGRARIEDEFDIAHAVEPLYQRFAVGAMSGDRTRVTCGLGPLPVRSTPRPEPALDGRAAPWPAPDLSVARVNELGKLLLWITLLIPNLIARLGACLCAPVLGLLVNEGGRLPRRLRWFETADNTAFGDRRHAQRWDQRPLYPRFVAWLWRNKAYTFSNEILGARTVGPVVVSGNPGIGDRPLVEGWCLRRTSEGYWHLYVVRRWGLGFFLRVNLGWKLWGVPGGPNFGQYVFTVNPFLRAR